MVRHSVVEVSRTMWWLSKVRQWVVTTRGLDSGISACSSVQSWSIWTSSSTTLYLYHINHINSIEMVRQYRKESFS